MLAWLVSGHEGLKELEEYEAWKREQTRLQDEVASKLKHKMFRLVL